MTVHGASRLRVRQTPGPGGERRRERRTGPCDPWRRRRILRRRIRCATASCNASCVDAPPTNWQGPYAIYGRRGLAAADAPRVRARRRVLHRRVRRRGSAAGRTGEVLVRMRPRDRGHVRVSGGQPLLQRKLHADLFPREPGDWTELHDDQRQLVRRDALHGHTRRSVGHVRARVTTTTLPAARVADERASLRDAFPAAGVGAAKGAALCAAAGGYRSRALTAWRERVNGPVLPAIRRSARTTPRARRYPRLQ